MNTKKKAVLAAGALACLAAGAGLERVRQTVISAKPAPVEAVAADKHVRPPPARTIIVTNTAAERAANEALRKRVVELEQALAERPAEPLPSVAQPGEANLPERPRRQSFSERLEQMKREDPEQYAEMQKRREEFRQSMEQRAQERATFIATVETKNMTDEQRENHEKLLETVARVNELTAQMGQADGERSADLRHEMGETMHALGELYGAERRYLFEETARAIGYEGDQASAFAEHLQTIIDNTSMSGFGRRGGHGYAAPPAGGAR